MSDHTPRLWWIDKDRADHIHASLLAARIAHQHRARSMDAYRKAIRDATHAGCTYTEIADTLGITRQAVRQYTLTNT